MKKPILAVCITFSAGLLAACEKPSNHPMKHRGEVTQASLYAFEEEPITGILIKKSRGKMHLVSNGRIVDTYKIDLGFSPKGDKKVEGDGKTPEGNYYIDRKNPQSEFYLSLGISYPNAQDRQEAAALGQSPGGDIFIHGQGRWGRGQSGVDWTRGCVAVTDAEMDEIFDRVRVGTPVTITP